MNFQQPKIRFLSYHHIPNNGAFLFSYSLLKLLQREFVSFEVKTLDYKSKRLASYEFLKRFKLHLGDPFFYDKRARMWNRQLSEYLDLDNDFPHFVNERKLREYFAGKYSALVVGMDVWCIINGTERPGFPNIYWLPEKTNIPKFAYGVSAYNSNPKLIQHSITQIENFLDGFDVIGTRDRFTFNLVQKHRHRTDGLIEMIPDPTFLYENMDTSVTDKLEDVGVDLSRPILGLLFYGDGKLSRKIQSYYKTNGYQILALGMYNPIADFNLGHILTPFEWADAFRYLSFCITDRFHGTIFCLLSQTPFISLEKDRHLSLEQSKLYDLLKGFGFETLYQNPAKENFSSGLFLAYAEDVQATWDTTFKPSIQPQIDSFRQAHTNFIFKMKSNLEGKTPGI